MPTYEYECLDCLKTFEEFQSISEPPIDKCVYCGGRATRKLSGGIGIIFKASGFYSTDSRKSKSAAISGSKTDTGVTGEQKAGDLSQTGKSSNSTTCAGSKSNANTNSGSLKESA